VTIFQHLFVFLNQFIALTEEEFAMLRQKTEIRQYKKNDMLIRPGDVESHLYFVHKGLIREYFLKAKQQVTTDIIGDGTITGSVTSFFTGQPSRYCLQAIEPSVVVAISRDDLENLYRSDRKWERLGRVLTTHFFLQKERHLLDNMRFTTRERFIHFMNENPALLQKVPQKHLASYLNIKPETFSRMKHLMQGRKTRPKN
jgi:CRP-like cAMP-binding protein